MTLFDWLQSCSIEDFAAWLVVFQDQCEENVVEQFIKSGCNVTKISLNEDLCVLRVVEFLQGDIEEDDGV